MKRLYLTFLTVMLLTASLVQAQTSTLKPYQAGDWKSVSKTTNATPIAIHFWGVTCPACVKEMPQWGQFLKSNPNAKVIFIQVDDVSPDSMMKMLNKAGLDKANNYYVSGSFDERLRFEIDPQWHGETPMTITIDKSGKATRKTGLVDFQKLQNALNPRS